MPDDYDVFDKGEVVGRIYRIRDTEKWRWTVRLDEPTGGMADTLDEAKAALRRAWDAHGFSGEGFFHRQGIASTQS